MHHSLRLAFAALVAVVPFCVAAQTHPAAAEQLTRLVARYDSAWNRRDSLTVNQLLAPNYQYFTW
jgi:outer membrane lipoprotein-sorting protein